MGRVRLTLALLCVMALAATLCGCGGSSGLSAGTDAVAKKPPKPPPDDAGMMDPDIVYVRNDDAVFVISDDGSESTQIEKPRSGSFTSRSRRESSRPTTVYRRISGPSGPARID